MNETLMEANVFNLADQTLENYGSNMSVVGVDEDNFGVELTLTKYDSTDSEALRELISEVEVKFDLDQVSELNHVTQDRFHLVFDKIEA